MSEGRLTMRQKWVIILVLFVLLVVVLFTVAV
jgi:hypothetical protein